jgi:hypothetical protein
MRNSLRSKDSKKKDISLMTLLAYESTNDARKLLQKYKQPDAKGFSDLESKLANLYFKVDDKLQLEKEMAEIHPHKKWLLETLQPVIEIKKEEIKMELKPELELPKKEEEPKSNFNSNCCGGCNCNCSSTTNSMQGFVGSNFAGQEQNKAEEKDYFKQTLPLVGVIAVVGIIFYALSKK